MDDDWYNEYYLFDAGRASTSVAHGMQAGRFRHLSDDDKHDIQAAINALYEAFPWCDSLEGHDYWEDVVKKLETKLRDGRL